MTIPPLPRDEFAQRVLAAVPDVELDGASLERLWSHFEELRRWAPRVDLIGPGTAHEVPERHFAESLAALPWFQAGPASLLDIGSGAGFPGLVLAATRPDLEVTLAEPRQRRRAFLAAVARRAALDVRLLEVGITGRTAGELPEDLEVITLRALQLPPRVWAVLASRLHAGARVLVWSGARADQLGAGFEAGRERLLAGSRERVLREYILREKR